MGVGCMSVWGGAVGARMKLDARDVLAACAWLTSLAPGAHVANDLPLYALLASAHTFLVKDFSLIFKGARHSNVRFFSFFL